MRFPMTLIYAAYLSLMLMILGSMTVRCEPEPMARPTRPKVFTNPEELRQYLDLVRDYYSLNGKARYGKRAEPFSIQRYEQPMNFLRTILAISRKEQLRDQQEKHDQIIKDDISKWQKVHPYDHLASYYEIME